MNILHSDQWDIYTAVGKLISLAGFYDPPTAG